MLGHLTAALLGLLVLSEELLQRAGIETSGLLVDERCLQEHGVGTLVEHILQFLIRNGETQLLSLVSDNLLLHVVLPHHVLDLVEFLVGQVVASLSHLNHIGVLVDESLELLYIDFLS